MSVRTQRVQRVFLCLLILGVLYVAQMCIWPSVNKSDEHKSDVSLKQLLAAAIRAAEIGGLEVTAVHNQVQFKIESKGQTKEGVNDPVTAADYRSHCVMYGSLTKAFPGVAVISEETSQDCDKIVIEDIRKSLKNLDGHDINDEIVDIKDVTVWIDPLDATKEFTENLLQYVSTMVCVAVKEKPVIGVIFKPFETSQHNLYWAWINHGTSKNLKNLTKIKKENEKRTLIVSRSHAGQVKNTSRIAFGNNVEIISAAGAGYKFLEVAVGNVTAYIHTTDIKKWDICAGTAILGALKGTVTQLYEQEPIYFGAKDPKVLTKGLFAIMN